MLHLGHFCDRAPICRDGKGSYLSHSSGTLESHYVGVCVQLSERRVLAQVCVKFQFRHLGNAGSIGGNSKCGNSPIGAVIHIGEDICVCIRFHP